MDLTTPYLGLDLRSPIVASASPLNGHVDLALEVEAAGAAAIVMPSLFEEEILHEELEMTRSLEAGAEHHAEALDYFPDVGEYMTTTDRYLATLEQLSTRCEVPVIGSLNATSPGGWTWHASLIEQAGAAALELNLYHLATDPTVDAVAMEDRDLQIIDAVRTAVSIPVAVKLSPYYSSMANFAARVVDEGADGLVLFNRFYQPDLDLESLAVVNTVELSRPGEMRLPLRWIAILRPQLGPDVSLALTTGVHTGTDVVKALMAGADVAMTTSALLREGPAHLRTLEAQLVGWLEEHEYESVAQLRGSATTATSGDAAAFERTNYVKVLHSWATPPRRVPGPPLSS